MSPGAYLGSMAGRVFLILAAGIVVSALVTHELAEHRRRELMAQFRVTRNADRVAQLVSQFEATTPAERPRLAASLALLGVSAVLGPIDTPRGQPDPTLAATVRAAIDTRSPVAAVRAPESACPPRSPRAGRQGSPPLAFPATPVPGEATDPASAPLPEPPRHRGICRVVQVRLADGTALRIAAPSGRPLGRPPLPPFTGWPYPLVFLACIGLLAYLVARMATGPLRRLASAAADFGEDISTPPIAVDGPTEVRRAAVAFNTMQARIRNHVEERTQMLAAIAHDLQTPLTRLRLRLEKVADEELRARLIDDLGQMQQTIREGLELLRSASTGDPLETLDLDSLLEAVCTDATDAGQDVTLEGRLGTPLRGRPNALRRCIDNLIDNAVKYGQRAALTVRRDRDHAVISIRDAGPGIPPEQIEAVFRPFYRLETSRSRDTGGTGLGLAIARNLAEQQGGSLSLRNHPQGGLEAALRLPLSLR